jgi:DNA polymerase-3 subunit epsilon
VTAAPRPEPPPRAGGLRLRLLGPLLLLAAGGAASAGAGLWIAAVQRPEGMPLEPLAVVAAVAGFGTLALGAVLALRFDDRVVRPLAALAAEMRARAHGAVDAPLDLRAAEGLGEVGPAAAALCTRLAAARGEADRIVGEATARLAEERAQLSAILSEIPVGIMALGPDGRVLLYDRQTVDLLGDVAPLGLGRPATDYFAASAIEAARAALAAGTSYTDADLPTADGLRRVRARLRPIGREGGLLLALETDGETLSERPLVFDFDLLREEAARDLAATPLARLPCVVLDTETTGLSPEADEIVQIGAVRIVNGRRVEGEVFETLVDPGRPIPPASTRVHGIHDAAVAGAPDAQAAVRAFCRFAEGAVLVAHNAPFDLAFLRRHARAAGIELGHGVLDTVLLSAAVYGQGVPHTLDAIAERLGVALDPAVRHTALGDAVATAEVLLKLIPVLEAAGIATFGEAVAAMRRHQRLLPDMNG